MKIEKKEVQTGGLATILSLLMTYTGYEAIIKPSYQDYKLDVQSEIREYVKSDEYNDSFHKRKFLEFIESPAYKEHLAKYLEVAPEGGGNRMSLRTLLAVKFDVSEEEVPNVLYKIYNTIELEKKDKKRLDNLLRAVNAEHPQYKVWETQE